MRASRIRYVQVYRDLDRLRFFERELDDSGDLEQQMRASRIRYVQVYRDLGRLRFFEPELDDDVGELEHHMRASPIR